MGPREQGLQAQVTESKHLQTVLKVGQMILNGSFSQPHSLKSTGCSVVSDSATPFMGFSKQEY